MPSACCRAVLAVLVLTLSSACARSADSPTGPSAVLTVASNAPQAGDPPPAPDPLGTVTALGATRYMAFGDSITCGVTGVFPLMDISFDGVDCAQATGGTEYPRIARTLLQNASPSQTILLDNYGQPGEFASLAYSRFSNLMASRRPQGVLLLEGINDLNNGRSVSATVSAISAMLDLAAFYNSTVLVGTMFQTCRSENPNTGRVRENSTELIVPYNTALRAMVSGRQNVYIVDLYAAFGTGNCRSDPDRGTNYLGDDGLHPSPTGYTRIASTFANAVRDRFAVRGSFQ